MRNYCHISFLDTRSSLHVKVVVENATAVTRALGIATSLGWSNAAVLFPGQTERVRSAAFTDYTDGYSRLLIIVQTDYLGAF